MASITAQGIKDLQPLAEDSQNGKTQKINFKSWRVFSSPKSTTQNTTNTTHSTTNSPHFYHHKTPENRKTHSKNHPFSRQIIFCKTRPHLTYFAIKAD